MARIIATFMSTGFFSSPCMKTITKTIFPSIFATRNLYCQSTLGIDGYLQAREKIKVQFVNMSDKFRTKMSEYVSDPSSKTLIFTEDLKNMIHLAEDNSSDMELILNMMKKFNAQNKELRFGSFIFGPVVMRMFYFLNKPKEALECFKSEELQGFFDQLMSYQLLLDLLYENAQYDDVIQTFELIKSKQIQGTKYPKNIVVLTMAACYKKNTMESLQFALNLWKELHEVGHLPMRRAATFCAGLALNMKKYEVALEIVSTVRKQNYMTVRNIKVMALAGIGRVDDALSVLRSVLDIDDPNNTKHTFSSDVLKIINDAVEKDSNPSIKKEFQRINKLLTDNGHINEKSLDTQLCSEIEAPPNVNFHQRNPAFNTNSNRDQYQGRRSNNYRVLNQRPGLRDMS